MSHGEPDFLFEAVANSLEAGANRIVIDYKRYQEFVDITVTDDGEGFSCDVFSKGVSAKGKNRGNGLFLLKEKALSCSIKRENSFTTLFYRMRLAESSPLSEVLPFIFSYADNEVAIEFAFCSEVLNERISSDALKVEFGTLNSVRALSALKKRFSMFDL